MTKPNRPVAVRFVPAVIAALAVLGGGVWWKAHAQPAPDPDGLLAQLAAQPADVSIVAYGVRPNGTPDPAQPSVLVNPDQPMPLASSRKIVLLAAYARAVSERKLDPAQPVKLADWEAYYLPGTDGGAHPAALKRLNIQPGGVATPDQIAGAMIRESDNAAADYLYTRVGAEAIQDAIRDAGLRGQDPLFPLSGEVRAWSRGPVDTTLQLTREAFRAEAIRDTPAPGRPPTPPAPPSPADQARLADAFTVRGTARDFAGIMARVMTGTFLNKTISAIMARHLEWPLDDANLGKNFERFGVKGGELAGVLTENLFMLPKVGPAKGRLIVGSIFMRRVAPDQQQQRKSAMDLFVLRSAVLPDFAAKVNTQLGGASIGP